MLNPTTALAWELWSRHRPRILAIIGVLLGFALIYPQLCAMAGLHLGKADTLEEFGQIAIGSREAGFSFARVIHILCLLFLTMGPTVAMFMSLVYVGWMFTLCEVDARTKNPMAFPVRLFNLPVSTAFLFVRVWLGGMASIALVYLAWTHLVTLPRLDIFIPYQNCLGWMALLAVAQGITWMPVGPNLRALVMAAVFFIFTFSPTARDVFELPYLFPLILLAGTALAYFSLQALRENQFQGLAGRLSSVANRNPAEMRGPKQFASPTRAQMWFVWRRSGRAICFYTALLAVVPVAVHVALRYAFGRGVLQGETMTFFAVYLAAVPLFLSFCHSAIPGQTVLPFVLNRPQTNGAIMMAVLKTGAISTVISWLIVLASFGAMPLLGNLREAVLKDGPPQCLVIVVVGLLFLTWRMTAVNLPFIWSGARGLGNVPVLMSVIIGPMIAIVFAMADHPAFWAPYFRLVPALLVCLLLVKFVLATAAFRICIKRGLLLPSALIGYLAVWLILVAMLAGMDVAVLPIGRENMFSILLLTVLLVPLARIGFCPIALSWNRHG